MEMREDHYTLHRCTCGHQRVQHRASIYDTWVQCFKCKCNVFARNWDPPELSNKGETNG